jgi:hypothetical protein
MIAMMSDQIILLLPRAKKILITDREGILAKQPIIGNRSKEDREIGKIEEGVTTPPPPPGGCFHERKTSEIRTPYYSLTQ